MRTRQHEVDQFDVSHGTTSIVRLPECRHLKDEISVIREYLESKRTSLHRRETP